MTVPVRATKFVRFLPGTWPDAGRRDRSQGLRGFVSKKLCVPWVSSGLFQQIRIEGSSWAFVGREPWNPEQQGRAESLSRFPTGAQRWPRGCGQTCRGPVEGAAVIHVDQIICKQGLLRSDDQRSTGSESLGGGQMDSSSITRWLRSLPIFLTLRGIRRKMENERILNHQNICPKGIKETPMSELTLRTDVRLSCPPSMEVHGVLLRAMLSLIFNFCIQTVKFRSST